ncbi:cupin domain-containing protein [Leisingera sp. NJS201]|uniref:cupin domain-containing protein n=1 Tax=Leisingera sp. NJS201 TaxID=2508306 RepID=UPI0010706B49|nr:cupin domain-containing protein [Leisingera sp. NJS201]QBR37309.1 cupin domain-containing protein [Leisingera sp. NJS201]
MSTIQERIVRYGELKPCKTAFIDAHTPGSDQKENFTIIGGGVSESPDQHVHITDKIGFNIGAAGQPPKCRNSLHSHTTAEVFFVAKGRWRFFWGRYGTAGEFIAEEGDIFNIPTGMFRGFENVGQDYGMIMSILGGDDAGGGVTWAPQVIEDAQAHGLMLGHNGVLYDSKKGQELPHNVQPMPVLTEEELKAYPEVPVENVIGKYVARYWDLMALSAKQPVKVIGEEALIRDKPGFEVDFLGRGSAVSEQVKAERPVVLMPASGHWRIAINEVETTLSNGDTALVLPGESYSAEPSMTGNAGLYRITATDDPAGATWQG